MTLINALMICFSLAVICSGCLTAKTSKDVWPMPRTPSYQHVQIIPMSQATNTTEGFFISNSDATNLVNNVDNLKAHVKKLELLVETMSKVYGFKLEEK